MTYTEFLLAAIITTRGTGETQGVSIGFQIMNKKILGGATGGSVVSDNILALLYGSIDLLLFSQQQYHTIYPAGLGQDSEKGSEDVSRLNQEITLPLFQ